MCLYLPFGYSDLFGEVEHGIKLPSFLVIGYGRSAAHFLGEDSPGIRCESDVGLVGLVKITSCSHSSMTCLFLSIVVLSLSTWGYGYFLQDGGSSYFPNLALNNIVQHVSVSMEDGATLKRLSQE